MSPLRPPRPPRRWLLRLVTFLLAGLVGLVASRPSLRADDEVASRSFETSRGGPTLTLGSRVETGVQPKSVSISGDGRVLAVANFGFADHDNVYLYDSESLARIGTVSFPGNAVESVFSRDGRTLFVSNFRQSRVEVIELAGCTASAPCSLTPRASIATGAHPKWMVLSADERTLYVANWSDESVSMIDLARGVEQRRLPTGRHPRGLALLADGTVIAASFEEHTLHLFSAEGEARGTVRVCQMPRHLVTAPDGVHLYVTCSMGFVGLYEPHTGRRLGTGWLGRNPRTIAATRDGRFVAAANFTSGGVSLVDMIGHTHRSLPIEHADRIVGVAIHPDSTRLRLYATSWDGAELIAVEGRR